jgi:sulfatase modifying factor 1
MTASARPAPPLLATPAGRIGLRDEGSGTTWQVEVPTFRIAPVPVTVGEFHGGDSRLPVAEVSWFDALRFCNARSEEEGLQPCYTLGGDPDGLDVVWDRSADGYRLPTEAEWEFACRAGSTDARSGELDDIAWYRGNSGGHPHEVGTRAPNAWGLHDTIGNVWEWCWDRFDTEVYGPYRVFRGGGWFDPPRACRPSCRRKSHPTLTIDDLGFRLARSA